ncbi:MAG: polysaccharide biosynthesis/export family protein [Bacteroidia bacterium]|nr:polysaccharide biosynthesis/export family protein [Bacteroidia bacterium]
MKPCFYIILLMLIINVSCTHHKNIIYFQSTEKNDTTSFFKNDEPEYIIQNNDILYVRVLSINKDIVELYNLESASGYLWSSDASLFINGFSVDKNGFIQLPMLESIKVSGLTLIETQKVIQKEVNEYLRDATVIVKLVSFKITVLGEVNYPGAKDIHKNQVNIFEVLGMAGDITPMGNKKNVLLIRPDANGSKTYRIDLTDKSLLCSQFYYLLPNDVIYVEPVKGKALQANAVNISLFLSAFASILSLLTVIRYYY